MSLAARNWDDLRPRVITGVALIAVGITVIWIGGIVFALVAALVTGVMVWELARMIAPERASEALILAFLTAATILLVRGIGDVTGFIFLAVPAIAGVLMLKRHPVIFAVFAIGITLAGFGLTLYRDTYGVVWLFWLVIVVAGTDIAGYFQSASDDCAELWWPGRSCPRNQALGARS